MSKVSGVILAGGLGSRMQGANKALVLYRGKALIQWVIDALRPQVDELAISLHAPSDVFSAFGLPLLFDCSQRMGPLGGVLGALQQSASARTLFAPCDAPLLPPDLRKRLQSAVPSYAQTDDGPQPCCCFIDRARLPATWAQTDTRSMQQWLASIGASAVQFPDSQAFMNINSLSDLESINVLDA